MAKATGDAFQHLLKTPTKSLGGKLLSGAKRFGPEMVGWLLLEKYLSGRHESKLTDIQTQATRGMAELQSPENIYLQQAALPQAQQEEEMARTALLTQISGGVIGPQLARGERRIGR